MTNMIYECNNFQMTTWLCTRDLGPDSLDFCGTYNPRAIEACTKCDTRRGRGALAVNINGRAFAYLLHVMEGKETWLLIGSGRFF
jgi:hypothetical protein